MTKQCRNGAHALDARTEAAGGEVCFDCATAKPVAGGYTPGPWAVSRDAVPEGHVQYTVYAEVHGKRVATAFEAEGNARLIAAAPELVDWVREIVGNGRWLIDDRSIGSTEAEDLVRQGRALLARIAGE